MNTATLPVLKSGETRALLEKARAGDKEAREELISGNLRLVLSVVQRFANRGESMDDLFQVGCIGLIKAIDDFDLNQNYPTEKTPLDELHAQATKDFIREYLRIQPVRAEDYNARRTHPSRGWYAIAKYNHTRRWRILLEKLNLPIYNNRGTPNSTPRLKVRVISDYNFEE